MNKKILLSLALAGLLPATSFAGVEVSNLKLEGNVGIMADTIDDSKRMVNAFDTGSTRIGSYAGLKVTGDINGATDFGISLKGIDSLNYINNIQGNSKTDAVVDEIYVKYRTDDTVVKVGRSKFDSPLVFSDTYRPIANSYDMVSVSNKSLADTYLFGGLILRANTVDDLSFTAMNRPNNDKTAPIAVLGGLFQGIEYFPVQAWAYAQEKGMMGAYISTESKFTTDLNLALQYSYTTNEGVTNSEAISMLGANVAYDINDKWSVDIAFNQVSAGDDLNTPANMSNKRTSKLYTSIRTAGEFMGQDESTLADTTSFSITAKGDLKEGYGKLNVAFGTYHHLSGTASNSNANTTHVGELAWTKQIDSHLSTGVNLGYVSYQTADVNGDNERNNGQYASLMVNYSF